MGGQRAAELLLLVPLLLCAALHSAHCEQRIVEEPQDTRVAQHDDVRLRCQVREQGGAVMWSHDNFVLPSERQMSSYPRHSMVGNSDEFDLSIKRVTIEDDGEYRCHILQTPSDGRVFSRIAILTVLVPPTIARLTSVPYAGGRPQLSARQGAQTTARCETDGARPSAGIRWAVLAQLPKAANGGGTVARNELRVLRYLSADNDNETDTASIVVKTEGKLSSVVSTLRYEPVMEDDGQFLACIVEHEASDGVLLAAAHLAVEYAPLVTMQLLSPSGTSVGSVMSGTRAASVQCGVQAKPPDVTIQWYRRGHKLSWATNQATLTIQEVDRSWHGNELSCEATNAAGRRIASISLNVTYGPRITASSPATVAASQGEHVTLSCTTDANPPARVTWSSVDAPDKVLHIGNNFTLNPVREWQAGAYRCTASSPGFQPKHRDVTLKIKGPPKVRAYHAEASQGAKTSITCRVTGFPFASDIAWFKVTQAGLARIEAFAGGSRVQIINREVDNGIVSILEVDDVQPIDFGAYNCTAVNEFGMDFAIAKLAPTDKLPLYLIVPAAAACAVLVSLCILCCVAVRRSCACCGGGRNRAEKMSNSDAHSDVTVKVETLDGRDYPTPDMYGAHAFDALDVSFGKDYVSVPADNPDVDLLPPPYVQYAAFRHMAAAAAAAAAAGNNNNNGGPLPADMAEHSVASCASPAHSAAQLYRPSPTGGGGGAPYGTVPRAHQVAQAPVFYEEYHGRLVAPNGDVYYATSAGGNSPSHCAVVPQADLMLVGGPQQQQQQPPPAILTRPDHPSLVHAAVSHEQAQYMAPGPSGAAIAACRPYVPVMASGPATTALETVVEVQTPDTPRSINSLYVRPAAAYGTRDTVVTALPQPHTAAAGGQSNGAQRLSPEHSTPSSTDV